MRIIPVIDLLNGVAVRAVAGRRREYRPLVSRLCRTNSPLDIANSFRGSFGLEELYLADLDAIAGAEPDFSLFAQLRSRNFQLWLDTGVRTAGAAERLANAGVERVVVGLETIRGPDELRLLVDRWGARIAFSLDLHAGRTLGNRLAWHTDDAETIAGRVVEAGVRRVIVLDLARVGLGEGIGTEELCVRISRQFPDVELIAGGGIKNRDDLDRVEQCGATAVLVASALHDGTLP